jgi:inner membrane protein involved in colicin E2 resistance
MVKRIAAIALIWICTAVGWSILGSSIFIRTQDSDAKLEGRVANIWGAPQKQSPPKVQFYRMEVQTVEQLEQEKRVLRKELRNVWTPASIESSRIQVALNLDHRQKGLMWYSTYAVDFAAEYGVLNPASEEQEFELRMNYPAEQAVYDHLVFQLNGESLPLTHEKNLVKSVGRIAGGATAKLRVSYRSQGLSTWSYDFGSEVSQVSDFELRMRTNFDDIDFPENTLAPTEKKQLHNGKELIWSYKNLVTGYDIAMIMPEKLQPGPLAGRISYFAPVSLFFFFFLMFIITTLRNIELHPMNYFFLAAAFFAFHLLLAYLVDHISIHLAFVICSLVSIFLVVSYLRLVTGIRFAAVEAGLAQLIYLVGFSYAFFFKGFTGLTVTIGAIVTLFVVMQMTGKIKWGEKFSNAALVRP